MSLVECTKLELISLIWLDNMANATQENREVQKKLRSIINDLKVFDNCEQCQKYLQNQINVEEDQIILIVSGRLGQQIIDDIHHLKQVISVFVFCFDKELNEKWAKKYKKVRGVLTEVDDLFQEIELDRMSDNHKIRQPIDILPGERNEILSTLLEIPSTLMDKKQLLDICQKEYQGNTSEIERIQDFEHLYSSSKALDYFIRETFLYRLLIKSLQIFNIEMLFLLRFFLQDIEQQLELCPPVSIPLYRAQFMTKQQIDFLKNSTHQTILRFNSYLIAKPNREEVLQSLRNSVNTTDLHGVLFHIEINHINRQYGQVILFPITTLFRILSIDHQNDTYHIKIVVSNLISSVNKKTSTAIQLGHQLRNLDRLDDAEKLFNRLLSQRPLENAQLYDGLARIAQDKGLYETSLQFYEKSLLHISSKDRAHCLNNIGCIYDSLEQYDLAFDFYSQALKLMRNAIDRAMCLNNIGITLANQQQYEKALDYFHQSLAIRERTLAKNHPDLAVSYANMGVLCSSTDQPDLALEYYQKALKVFLEKNLHIYRAIAYQNIAQILSEKNQSNEALNYYEQAAMIFRRSRPPNHPNVLFVEQNIRQLTMIK